MKKVLIKRVEWWDALAILGTVLILAWAFLKAIGVIHSPVWVEVIPYFGIGATFAGFIYKLGKIMEGIEGTKKTVDRLVNMESRFIRLEHEHSLAMMGKLNVQH